MVAPSKAGGATAAARPRPGPLAIRPAAPFIYQHKAATADRQIADGLDTLLRASQGPSQVNGQAAGVKGTLG